VAYIYLKRKAGSGIPFDERKGKEGGKGKETPASAGLLRLVATGLLGRSLNLGGGKREKKREKRNPGPLGAIETAVTGS